VLAAHDFQIVGVTLCLILLSSVAWLQAWRYSPLNAMLVVVVYKTCFLAVMAACNRQGNHQAPA
jgi:hypothetical protein